MYPSNNPVESFKEFIDQELKLIETSKEKEQLNGLLILKTMTENKIIRNFISNIDKLLYVLYLFYAVKDVNKDKNLTISFHSIKHFLVDFEIYPQLVNFQELKQYFYLVYEKLSKINKIKI